MKSNKYSSVNKHNINTSSIEALKFSQIYITLEVIKNKIKKIYNIIL